MVTEPFRPVLDLPPGIEVRVAPATGWPEEGYATLSPEERARVETFRAEKRRGEFVWGRVWMRRLLAERLGVAPECAPLRVDAEGALEVPDAPLWASLSHAGGLVAAGVADRPVGVDLEQIRPRSPRLRDFLLHPDERDLFERLPGDLSERLILVWTLKEAVLKGLRTGLRTGPRTLCLSVDPGRRRAYAPVAGGWELRFDRVADCFLAVAFPAP